jgi:hypothetical protein
LSRPLTGQPVKAEFVIPMDGMYDVAFRFNRTAPGLPRLNNPPKIPARIGVTDSSGVRGGKENGGSWGGDDVADMPYRFDAHRGERLTLSVEGMESAKSYTAYKPTLEVTRMPNEYATYLVRHDLGLLGAIILATAALVIAMVNANRPRG